jgi:hypothetical protein
MYAFNLTLHNSEQAKEHHIMYKKQFKQQLLIIKHDVNTLTN